MILREKKEEKMLIVSASNITTSKENSKSLMVANKIKSGLLTYQILDIQVIDLREYRFGFCIMCEKCIANQKCIQDDDFNDFISKWNENKEIIIVVPHYALIPSKLICCFEKIQEMYYLNYCLGKENNIKKRVMIIAHGGMTENYIDVYNNNIIKPLSDIVESIGCSVVNNRINEPLCFGVKKYLETKNMNSICFAKEDDKEIENKIIDKVIDYYAQRRDL
jgi:hypothetical protein